MSEINYFKFFIIRLWSLLIRPHTFFGREESHVAEPPASGGRYVLPPVHILSDTRRWCALLFFVGSHTPHTTCTNVLQLLTIGCGAIAPDEAIDRQLSTELAAGWCSRSATPRLVARPRIRVNIAYEYGKTDPLYLYTVAIVSWVWFILSRPIKMWWFRLSEYYSIMNLLYHEQYS
jgi:hypothetical protein